MLTTIKKTGSHGEGLAIESFADDQTYPDARFWIVSAPEEEATARILAQCLSDWGRKAVVGTLAAFQNRRDQESVHVVSVSLDAPEELHASVERWVWPLGLPWTPCTFQLERMQLDVGPVFRREYSPSFASLSTIYDLHRGAHRTGLLKGHELAFWCNLLARSLLFFDSTARSFYPAQGWVRHDLENLSTRYNRTFCPSFATDSSVESEAGENIPATRLFEAYAMHERYAGTYTQDAARSALRHIADSLPPLSYPHSQKTFPGQPRSLPAWTVEQLLENPSARPAPWDRATLASILLYGAGVKMLSTTKDAVKRFAANAGNLGSCELGIFDAGSGALLRGLYRYRPVLHDLAQLQSHRWKEIERDLENHVLGETGISGHLVVLLCGKLKRLCEKYDAFGYKLMCLDAGVMFSQLKLLAHAFGFSLRLAPDMDRRLLTEAFQLAREDAELVATAVLTPAPGIACVTHSIHMPPGNPSDRNGNRLLLSADALGQELSDGVLRNKDRQQPTPPELLATSQTPGWRTEASPCESTASWSLQQVLQRRASIRRFSLDLIPEKVMSDMLLRAHRTDQSEWSCVTAASITFFVLYHAASHVERRLCRFDPMCGALIECTMPQLAARAPSLYVDLASHAAPMAIWAVGDLAEATRERGARGHQELLLRAGAALNRIWLMGIGRGLCGFMSAGVLGRTAHRELGFDGWRQLPLCTLLLGMRIADRESAGKHDA